MPNTTTWGFGTHLDVSYEEAVSCVKDALKAEGFEVLTEIDVRKTMREKLGVEMELYFILGASNPPLAHRALLEEPDIGLLLLPGDTVTREKNPFAPEQKARSEATKNLTPLQRCLIFW